MYRGEDDSPPYVSTYQGGLYSSPIASSASTSAASVWSDAASQSSDDSSVTSISSSDSETENYCYTNQPVPSFTQTNNGCDQTTVVTSWPKSKLGVELAPEQRQNPRRTSIGSTSRTGCPPSLVRQCERKVTFVDSLVDTSAQIVETIWPLSSVPCRIEIGSKGVLPLRTFIQETLRRSRTSYSTLQVALYYLILIKPHVPRHDFTMEQPDDAHSIRALQCGRRMFLAALILASKYLQDRNYSARAWSKISGLPTFEINQNEIAFLLAVNWELHITDAVFQRWTDIVLKYTPAQPPSLGPASFCTTEQSAEWRSIILRLSPQLDNIGGFLPMTSATAHVKSLGASATPSLVPVASEHTHLGYGSNESTPISKYCKPSALEPSPTTVYPPTKLVPAFGLLPTPRLTPQSTGYNTPAVSATSCMLGRSSMGFAMAQAPSAYIGEKWQPYMTSSPQSYVSCRRYSLANSSSTMSSPESMVSDNSARTSRSSSISSATSLMSAPLSSKLDVQARCRYAKQCSEKQNRTVFATVPEYYSDSGPISSPDPYIQDEEAARALQELHSHPRSSSDASPTRAGAKRSRPRSTDNTLQENVREMLNGSCRPETNSVRPRTLMDAQSYGQVGVPRMNPSLGRKRVCCGTEATRGLTQPNLHPAFGGMGGVGMWSGILN